MLPWPKGNRRLRLTGKSVRGTIAAMPRRVQRSLVIRGDLHVHSSHSDCDHHAGALFTLGARCGKQAIAEMSQLASAGGMEYFALVNHASDPVQPHHADRFVNEKILFHLRETILHNARRSRKGATVLAGVEASILPYGDLDVDNAILSHLDIVIVSRHGGPRQLPVRITQNFLRVMKNPHVDVIGHPTRYLDTLSVAQWEEIVRQAEVTKTAIEFNLRIPFDETLAKLVAAANVMVVLGSDTHRETRGENVLVTQRNRRAQSLVQKLLRAGISPRQILNLKPLPEVMAWLHRRYT